MAARRMIEAMRAMLPVLVLLSLCAAQQTAPHERLSRADKLIVVVTPDWNAVSGTLRRY